jgi:16S rRNA (adenine1518-N6/adenine1519-N6)-dimethyltransferase
MDRDRPVPRPPWSVFRAELEREGFRPSKTLGQNFLLDRNLAHAIARDACVRSGDFVLEVGPGCGFLSVELAALGVDLLAIEIDPRLARVARRFLAGYPRVVFIEGDALAGKHALAPELSSRLPDAGAWHLVANLPYAIASPLLVLLTRLAHPPASLTVLVQLEVAERLASRPGEPAWGGIAAKLALDHRVRLLRRVPPELFWPRPRVESAVVRIERLRVAPPGIAGFDRLIDLLSQHRRKSLRAALRAGGVPTERVEGALRGAGLEALQRFEALAPDRLLELSHGIFAPEHGSFRS